MKTKHKSSSEKNVCNTLVVYHPYYQHFPVLWKNANGFNKIRNITYIMCIYRQ